VTFTDFHVHLDLVDTAAVAAGDLSRVVDLGAAAAPVAGDVEVVRAGRMLTAVGGYPSTRPWAQGGLFREVAEGEADAAVAEQVAVGASLIKIALNSDVGPVWPDALLAQVVAAAHARSLRVVAHVEGAGQAARAAEAGVDALAHTPWTERLDGALLDHFAATTTWISTLRIHTGRDQGMAIDNLRRFRAAGGRVLYGTDMGNGPCSGGVERDELAALREAGLSADDLVDALTGAGSILGSQESIDREAARARIAAMLAD
jgi:imidazolonepropionase-like amidohydrolase